jgi:hypothetical protein
MHAPTHKSVAYVYKDTLKKEENEANHCVIDLHCCFFVCQRDTSDLSTQNSELRLRLQCMEEQAQLRDGMIHLRVVCVCVCVCIYVCEREKEGGREGRRTRKWIEKNGRV